mgnify:CR=1 FL=1
MPPLNPIEFDSKKLDGSVAFVVPRHTLQATVSFDSLRMQLLIAWMVVVYWLYQAQVTVPAAPEFQIPGAALHIAAAGKARDPLRCKMLSH